MKDRFEVKEGTVVDHQTGLMWMREPLEGEFTFDEACGLKYEFTAMNTRFVW